MWCLLLRIWSRSWTANTRWVELIAFVSKFLSSCEERYSVNELELLGLVWSIDYLRNFLYGKQFKVTTADWPLLAILKEISSNMSYNNRLTRWVDRLLTYKFKKEHMPAAKVVPIDYIFRHPNQQAKKVSAYDEEFIVAELVLFSANHKIKKYNLHIWHYTRINYTYPLHCGIH